MKSLPENVKLLILNNLSLNDLKKVALVTKEFNNLTQKVDKVRKSIIEGFEKKFGFKFTHVIQENSSNNLEYTEDFEDLDDKTIRTELSYLNQLVFKQSPNSIFIRLALPPASYADDSSENSLSYFKKIREFFETHKVPFTIDCQFLGMGHCKHFIEVKNIDLLTLKNCLTPDNSSAMNPSKQ